MEPVQDVSPAPHRSSGGIAAALAAVGGLLGVLLGLVGVKLIERATDWQPLVTAWAIALAMGISSLTGIVFGIYPARRAALMNPVKALRHE